MYGGRRPYKICTPFDSRPDNICLSSSTFLYWQWKAYREYIRASLFPSVCWEKRQSSLIPTVVSLHLNTWQDRISITYHRYVARNMNGCSIGRHCSRKLTHIHILSLSVYTRSTTPCHNSSAVRIRFFTFPASTMSGGFCLYRHLTNSILRKTLLPILKRSLTKNTTQHGTASWAGTLVSYSFHFRLYTISYWL